MPLQNQKSSATVSTVPSGASASTRPIGGSGGGKWPGSVNHNRPSGPTARSFGTWNPSAATYVAAPSGATRWIPGTAGRKGGGGSNRPIAPKSMPPFWVTRTPPSAARAAPFAPPPTSARVSTRPVETVTRWSRPSMTLVTTSVSDPHHTGPSPNRIPSHTTSATTA